MRPKRNKKKISDMHMSNGSPIFLPTGLLNANSLKFIGRRNQVPYNWRIKKKK